MPDSSVMEFVSSLDAVLSREFAPWGFSAKYKEEPSFDEYDIEDKRTLVAMVQAVVDENPELRKLDPDDDEPVLGYYTIPTVSGTGTAQLQRELSSEVVND
jgi:hypothetical protein